MIPYSHQYVGNLEFYYETGMEGQMGCIFHDDRGISKNEHHKPEDPNSGPPHFKTLAWSIWFGNRVGIYTARIYDKQGNVVYQGSLTKDKEKMKKAKYRFSFIPKEITKKDWIKYCQLEYTVALLTNELPSAIKDKYKIKYDVSDQVFDDLTGKDALVIGISFNENSHCYYLNNNHANGRRFPWEVTQIDWTKRFREHMDAAAKAEGK